MTFKSRATSSSIPSDPEALLRDLRKKTIQGILAHQADMIRAYLPHVKVGDVALQLPTGSGKTLVGLLIAEWRRRRFQERVLYLCPTKQLVHQVVEQARTKYGIELHGFTGKKKDFDQVASGEWLNAEAVGVTTYSGLFNTSPFFTEPQCIILDDAHSAENYIASVWSFQVEKQSHAALFAALRSVLVTLLSPSERMSVLTERTKEAPWVAAVPTPAVQAKATEIVSVIDAHLADGDKQRFAWSMVRPIIDACQVYVSERAILIRPLIPPTHLHAPFEGARQRVYMSATLGSGGDLERITGRSAIHRIPAPAGWDRQGIGRRFFIFPNRSLNEGATKDLCVHMARRAGRSLYLVPEEGGMQRGKDIAAEAGLTVYEAKEIEETKGAFVQDPAAMAVIANRYDGIDLSGDECRLLFVDGLPRGANLQERFLSGRIGAQLLLEDRVLTRVVQAFGRCTRSANDFAGVVVLGEHLVRYLMTQERRTCLHPEIQAEVEFGLEQSKGLSAAGLLENLDHFLRQDDEWGSADTAIVAGRADLTQKPLPATALLASVVAEEVRYQRAMCAGNYPDAVEACRAILAKLTDPGLRGYRAWWFYLAGSAAFLAARRTPNADLSVARDYFMHAQKTASHLRWLCELALTLPRKTEASDADKAQDGALIQIERIEQVFDEWGVVHDATYAQKERTILDDILQDDDGKRFERGRELLGTLLGFEADHANGDATPDPWWIVDGSLCFAFEDHAEGKEATVFNATKARQAASHPVWLRAKYPDLANARFVSILITPCLTAADGALPHLESVRYWRLADFRAWAQSALAVIRELRCTYSHDGNLAWREQALERLHAARMTPGRIEDMLSLNAKDAMTPPKTG
jgi:hypothetical protein